MIPAKSIRLSAAIALLVALSTSTLTATVPSPAAAPEVIQTVIACHSIKDGPTRLQCFDSAVAKLDAATAQGDIAIFDRAQVEKTRHSLFGFNLPVLDIFGNHGNNQQRDAQENELKEVDGVISRVGQSAEGWRITLVDGAQWEQADDTMLGLPPKPGKAVVIRRGPLGSYKMTISGGQAMKVRRIQ